MEQEEVVIINIKTGEGVKSVGELKENIKELKGSLETLEIGTADYQRTLQELKVNQNALKDAMYATGTSMEQLSQDANGLGGSYNSLVHQMAQMKTSLRAIDVSTAEGMEKFKMQADAIKRVNDKLKELDAAQGNYQRNVGNYASHWEGLAEVMTKLPGTFGSVKKEVGDLGQSMKLLSTNPLIGIAGLLAPIVIKIANGLKDNDTALAAVKKGMDALKPVTDFFSGVLDSIAGILSEVITKVSAFFVSNGIFQKVINGVVGVGNAIMNFVVAPFKGVIAAIKVFQDEGVAGLRNAARAFKNEMKQGVAFRANYEAGAAAADAMIAGVRSRKKPAQTAASQVAKDAAEDAGKAAKEEWEKWLKEIDKLDEQRRSKKLKDQQEFDALLKEIVDQQNAEIEAEMKEYFAEEARLREQDLKDAEAKAKAKVQLMQTLASATSSILGSIADMYEANGDESAKQANKVKGLRIAAATIDTISGAIGAYMQSVQSIPPPFGAIIGAVQAAAVTAAGIANIAKMRSTTIPGATSSAGATVADASAIVSAPTVSTNVSAVRNITSASEEERLNRMASKSKVYLVTSELEAKQEDERVNVQESSF